MMTLLRRAFVTGALAAPAVASAQDKKPILEGLAHRAAIYLTPLYEMYKRRNRDIVEHGQKLNRLVRELSPQDGLLSAAAWLDLSGEPLFLRLPRMDERFYSAALLDPFTNIFAQVSRRLSGGTPKSRMIMGPAWTGDVSNEVTAIRVPARSAWLRVRIATTGEDEDVDIARGVQARVLLETPQQRNERRILEMRELMPSRTGTPTEPVADWPPPRPADRFDLFQTGLAMLGECTLSENDRRVLEDLAPLRLRPGRQFDARAFSEAERMAIAAGIADADAEIREKGSQARPGELLHRAWIARTALGAPVAAEKP
jgi:hypothetical protein